ncbi:hypothetical protein WN943_028543 [Citrus x changshan-huyou]
MHELKKYYLLLLYMINFILILMYDCLQVVSQQVTFSSSNYLVPKLLDGAVSQHITHGEMGHFFPVLDLRDKNVKLSPHFQAYAFASSD